MCAFWIPQNSFFLLRIMNKLFACPNLIAHVFHDMQRTMAIELHQFRHTTSFLAKYSIPLRCTDLFRKLFWLNRTSPNQPNFVSRLKCTWGSLQPLIIIICEMYQSLNYVFFVTIHKLCKARESGWSLKFWILGVWIATYRIRLMSIKRNRNTTTVYWIQMERMCCHVGGSCTFRHLTT